MGECNNNNEPFLAFGSGNHQCYVPGTNNVQVRNGNLVITTRIQNGNGKSFTSGRIRQRSNGITYGRFVIRTRLPQGKLLWPAIWLKAKDKSCYSEVDIMEAKGQDPTRTTFTAHLGRNGKNIVKHGTGTRTNAGFGFHEFQLIWTPTTLQWFVDGRMFFSQSLDPRNWFQRGKATCDRLPFSQPMSLILNTAVGGRQFSDNKITPQEAQFGWAKNTFEIDYVRIYQMR